ncbi:MAG: tetratricopeptide repeat protein [Phycisphaerales bacterium]
MTADQLKQVEDLFHRARELEPEDRAAFLDEACNGALDLRAEVESLLAHSDGGTSQMRLRPSDSENQTMVDRGPLSEGPGTRIGPYKILQQIGEGGFGVVYMAEQEYPVRRRVALKIIKLGMDTKQVIARFEAERQALAMMDHPNIATVLQAGATETGRPYFVMELVKGIPITHYCDKAKLSTRQRLDLFMQVCDAIQHAHQKGVIHRDIKPSNVLVTLHDTKAVPKVIDFGIAKATSARLTEKTLFTDFHYFIGTPEYMSPDQAEISGLDVDTRTDIYSLGVLLYELLTGTTPFDPVTLRKAGYGEIQRIIQEEEPPRPSTRVDTLARSRTDDTKLQRTDASHLSRAIRGDIDWIVMKAIEKDRTRRYQTANEFAADILRYLRGEAVIAGPPSVLYKMRRFVTRHRLGVTAAALITLALLAGLTLATFGFVQASMEARRSQRIADFLQTLFISTDPDEALAADMDVASMLGTAREIFGEDHATVAATLSSRALQLQSSGDLEAAETLFRQSLQLWRAQAGDDDPNVGRTLGRLGLLLVTKGDHEAAEQVLREALRIGRAQRTETLQTCDTMDSLARFLVNQGQLDEAQVLFRESVEIRKRLAPHQRLQIASTMGWLINVLSMAGKEKEAGELMPEYIKVWREAIPADSTFMGRVLVSLGVQWYIEHNQYDTAEPMLVEAMEIFHANDEPPSRHVTVALGGLFKIREERGDTIEALHTSLEWIEVARVYGGVQVEETVEEVADVAWRIVREPDLPDEQYALARQVIELCLAETPDSAALINSLGVLMYRQGDYTDALETLARSHETYSEQYDGGVPADLAFMAMAQYRLGNEAEARVTMTLLRAAMTNADLGASEDNRKHLAEAEGLIGGSP